MMVPNLSSIMAEMDPPTRSRVSLILAIAMAIGFLGVIGAEIALSIMGRVIPPQINSLLYVIAGGSLFGLGSHSGSTQTQSGAATATMASVAGGSPPPPAPPPSGGS